jgi:small subunit ribosomal protein S18
LEFTVPRTKKSATGQKLVKSTGSKEYVGVPRGYEPRPMYFDYKDVAGLKKFVTNQGKLMSRKRTGLSAAGQAALSNAVKRARYMGLMAFTPE